MTLEDVKQQPLLQTRSIANACEGSPETHAYILQCLNRFFSGDYGEVGQEDTEYNNTDLAQGEGHILARYKAKGNLDGDIYIEAHFSESIPGIDANNTMIMYCNER
jgi:hypothetical protein